MKSWEPNKPYKVKAWAIFYGKYKEIVGTNIGINAEGRMAIFETKERAKDYDDVSPIRRVEICVLKPKR